MGRMTISSPFGPVKPQFAACFPLFEAVQVAGQIGGTVRPAPIFDDFSKEWVIPATEHHTAQ